MLLLLLIGIIFLCIALMVWIAKINEKQLAADPEYQPPSKTIKCPTCGKEISKTAKMCPNCGHDFVPASTKFFNVMGIIVLVIVVVSVILPLLRLEISFRPY